MIEVMKDAPVRDPGDVGATDGSAEAVRLIGEMPWDDFVAFQTELQYAAVQESIRLGQSKTHRESAHAAEHYTDVAVNYMVSGDSRLRLILDSPLYGAARERVKQQAAQQDADVEIKDDWAGWVDRRQEEIDEIRRSIGVVARYEMPTHAVFPVIGNPSQDEAQEAEQAILAMGIQGVFMDAKNQADLVSAFTQHWGEAK